MNSEFVIAIHGLVYLDHKQESVSSEELAENICTNPARIRKVMAKLKKAGMVETKEGMGGGYHICQKAGEITLEDVCGILAQEPVKASWKSGSMDMDCMIASGMSGVLDGVYDTMNARCKEYLKTVTIADLEAQIFGKA